MSRPMLDKYTVTVPVSALRQLRRAAREDHAELIAAMWRASQAILDNRPFQPTWRASAVYWSKRVVESHFETVATLKGIDEAEWVPA